MTPLTSADLAAYDFSTEFDLDALNAGVNFRSLLLDEKAVKLRVEKLLALRERAEGDAKPSVREMTAYIRELAWIRAHKLLERIAGEEADILRLKQLADDPDHLPSASRLLLRGDDGFLQERIDSHQAETWNWLRDRVCDGTFERFAGKYIASWTTDESQVIVFDDPVNAGRLVSETFGVPMDMVAVTYVERADQMLMEVGDYSLDLLEER